MSATGTAVPPHRPTILVGYGEFGLEVLRRLLASTAPRGVLTWEEARGGAGPGERHIQDLALLWFPDPTVSSPEHIDHERAREGAALEMMRDLYSQIERVGEDESTPNERDLAEALSAAARTLLDAGARAGRRGALPLGLDVYLIARPSSREAIGTISRLLGEGMKQLTNNANLDRAVLGSEALNFLAILDFENYWDRSPEARNVRRALYDFVEQWRKRRAERKATLGRIYLVDGRTTEGMREPFHRIDEISLFLELLLFEGQRDGELPRLYQTAQNESALATFGVRLVERSAGLLAHLAAARFGIGWLEYMAGLGSDRNAVEPHHLRARLEPFAPETLDALLDADELRGDVEEELQKLENELTALPYGLADWPYRVRKRYEETLNKLEPALSAKAFALMGKVVAERLQKLPAELRAGIEEDLRAKDPVPVGSVLQLLETSLQDLDRMEEIVPPPPNDAEQKFKSIAGLHAEYEEFQDGRVDVEGLKNWWPLLALALSAGLTPILHQLLANIPPPDPTLFLPGRAYAVMQWINRPLILGGLVFLGVWGLGTGVFQRSIGRRVDRTRRFYDDADRGRFVDRLRSSMRPGGALRRPVDYLVDRLVFDMALSVRGDVTRELGRAAARLGQRKREMLWLSEQLRGFLRMHGFIGEDLRFTSGRLTREGSGIRYAMERKDDFERMLESNPANSERFRSEQTEHAPFDGWDERYSRSFLVPLELLDRLSRKYKDPIQHELSRAGSGPQQELMAGDLRAFLEQYGSFGLSFRFKTQEGLSPDQFYCLMPSLWQHLEGVRAKLSDLGIPMQSVFDGVSDGRAYLLRLQTGIDPSCLLESS
ncbi:MAG: hypothetical protein JOZ54_01145 [Acidobacteria bacterium]|nr:hypothetical protein [Acidobacteriota bacterium]